MARLLVTRPQPHAAGTAAALAALGHEPVLSPMLTVAPVTDAVISLDDVAGLALTSRTAVEATAALARVRPDLAALFAIPVFTVGAATAEAARAAGFEQVLSADGAVADLVRLIRQYVRPGDGTILHLGGAVRAGDLAGDLASAGHAVSTIVVYEAVPAKRLSEAAVAALSAGRLDAALVYSERTAAALVDAAAADGLTAALARLPCIGLLQHGLGHGGVERLAGGMHPLEPFGLQGRKQAVVQLGQRAGVGIGLVGERHLERVQHGQQLVDQSFAGPVGRRVLIALHALAVVLEVGLQPAERVEELVTLVRQLCRDLGVLGPGDGFERDQCLDVVDHVVARGRRGRTRLGGVGGVRRQDGVGLKVFG